MKIWAVVLFVSCLSTITSCQKDYEPLLIGKWKFKSMEAKIEGQTISMDINQMAATYGISVDSDEFDIEFRDNGYVCAGSGGDGVPYSVSGDQVTITTEVYSLTFTIKELTGNKMTWVYKDQDLDLVIRLRRA